MLCLSGSQLITVKAMDVDTGDGGAVKYTNVFGPKNDSLAIHPESGLITVAKKEHGFDREEARGNLLINNGVLSRKHAH